MHPRELYNTTSFRLALLFLGLFGLTSALLFAFIDWEIRDFLSDKVNEWVLREGRNRSGLDAATLERQLAARQGYDLGVERPMTLYSPDRERVAGSAVPFPSDLVGATAPHVFGTGIGLPRAPFRGMLWRLPSGHTLLVAQSIDELQQFNEVLFSAMIVASGFAATLGLAGAIMIGVGAVRRLDAITLAIRRIVAGDLSSRLPVDRSYGDVGRLVVVVNGMLDEIERLMREVKGVCDNITHDLRTPLTRLLGGLDRVRRRPASVDALTAGIDEAIVETQGILKTFNALLRIAEIEDGVRRAGFVEVDLNAVVSDAIDFYEPLADAKDIALSFERNGEAPELLWGDPSLLFEALANLIDNAIKFTPPGGTVIVELGAGPDGPEIRIEDTGPGIPEDERAKVLRRFHRAEPSRHEPGNGLGLSLVAAVARLHGMDLTITGSSGCRVTLKYFTPECGVLN